MNLTSYFPKAIKFPSSGKDYKKHSSLDIAQGLFADKINRSIVMSGNNIEVENGTLYLPFYTSMFLV